MNRDQGICRERDDWAGLDSLVEFEDQPCFPLPHPEVDQPTLFLVCLSPSSLHFYAVMRYILDGTWATSA